MGGSLPFGPWPGTCRTTSGGPFVLHGHPHREARRLAADGSPHVAPIWIMLDGDDVIFTTGADTIKGKSLSATDASPSASTTTARRSRS